MLIEFFSGFSPDILPCISPEMSTTFPLRITLLISSKMFKDFIQNYFLGISTRFSKKYFMSFSRDLDRSLATHFSRYSHRNSFRSTYTDGDMENFQKILIDYFFRTSEGVFLKFLNILVVESHQGIPEKFLHEVRRKFLLRFHQELSCDFIRYSS